MISTASAMPLSRYGSARWASSGLRKRRATSGELSPRCTSSEASARPIPSPCPSCWTRAGSGTASTIQRSGGTGNGLFNNFFGVENHATALAGIDEGAGANLAAAVERHLGEAGPAGRPVEGDHHPDRLDGAQPLVAGPERPVHVARGGVARGQGGLAAVLGFASPQVDLAPGLDLRLAHLGQPGLRFLARRLQPADEVRLLHPV